MVARLPGGTTAGRKKKSVLVAVLAVGEDENAPGAGHCRYGESCSSANINVGSVNGSLKSGRRAQQLLCTVYLTVE
jgi:hypothetical protein